MEPDAYQMRLRLKGAQDWGPWAECTREVASSCSAQKNDGPVEYQVRALFAGDESILERMAQRCERLEKELRWHIRVYRVADEAWSPKADEDRLFDLAMRKYD